MLTLLVGDKGSGMDLFSIHMVWLAKQVAFDRFLRTVKALGRKVVREEYNGSTMQKGTALQGRVQD